MKDKKLSDDVSSYFFSFILFPALLLCFFFLEVVITIKSVDLFVLSFRLFFRLVELFCRRKIQRSEIKGSFLKNGMILICRIQDSRLILTIKKIFEDVLDRPVHCVQSKNLFGQVEMINVTFYLN